MSIPVAFRSMRLRPAPRLLIVSGTAAIISGTAHFAIRGSLSTLGERLFPGPYGGFGYLGLGAVTACFALMIALALMQVGRTLALCAIGIPMAVVSLFLTAKALTVVSGPFASGPAFTTFVAADTVAVSSAFALAAALTEPRIPAWVRIWLPLAAATLATLGWTFPYLR